MASSAAETVIGAAVLAVAGGFLVFAANTADVAVGGQGYELKAEFRNIEGLDVGSDVRLGGVKIGTISGIELNPENYKSIVLLSMKEEVRIPLDSSARILDESLLGGTFIAIEPGADDFMLEDGSEIEYTQSKVNILDLVIKFAGGSDS